ncbi:MAG: shikimate kinase [Rikenellaceae bacterium]
MKIFLIGFMGCGKSTLGRQLARKLGYSFVDVDKYIEDEEGSLIPDIFAAKGQEYFREIERDSIKKLSEHSDCVIATGGGAPAYFDNMEVMNRAGLTIYLKMDSATLINRVVNSPNPRPLLMGKTREQMFALVDEMLSQREPFYHQATVVINGKNIKVTDLIEELKKW